MPMTPPHDRIACGLRQRVLDEQFDASDKLCIFIA
jgi:hypothetical protein